MRKRNLAHISHTNTYLHIYLHAAYSLMLSTMSEANSTPPPLTGVREEAEAKGWTMVLKNDLASPAWTQRARSSYLALLLLLSLHATQVVQSDIEFPRDHHFSWRAGRENWPILPVIFLVCPSGYPLTCLSLWLPASRPVAFCSPPVSRSVCLSACRSV